MDFGSQGVLVRPWSDMVPGEKGGGDVGRRVQTCLSAAFTTDRPIAKSEAAWVMTAYLADLLCPPPLKHTFYASNHDSDTNVLRLKHH